LERRSSRPAPARDDKELTFWNAVTARALLHAGTIFCREEWVLRGGEILDHLLTNHIEGVQLRTRPGENVPEGFLDDYASLAQACLVASGRADVLGEERCHGFLEAAERLALRIIDNFANENKTAYYFTSVDAPSPLLRQVEWYDNATPSGNSTLAHLFTGLSTLSANPVFRQAADHLRPSYATLLERVPNGIAYALTAWTQEASGMVVGKANSKGALIELANELSDRVWRPHWLMVDSEVPDGMWRICVGATCLPDFSSAEKAASAATLSPQAM
jgi:hypothetical protein